MRTVAAQLRNTGSVLTRLATLLGTVSEALDAEIELSEATVDSVITVFASVAGSISEASYQFGLAFELQNSISKSISET
jgi:hypothetical protein